MPQTDLIPSAFREGARCIANALATSDFDDVVITAHVNPDGDAVGAICCAAYLLQHFHRRCILYSSTGIPEFLSFLKLPCPIISNLEDAPFIPKSCFLVDLNAFYRIGGDLVEVAPKLLSVNVDHHEGCGIGTHASYIEPTAASTTQLMAYAAFAMALPIHEEFARAVALGVVTDTGGFAHANTSSESLELVASLMRMGLDLVELRQEIDNCISLNRMRLWGALTAEVKLLFDNQVAFCAVSREKLQQFSACRDDLEGFVEYLRRLKGVRISCILREDSADSCKFSFRSVKEIDVCEIAKSLNGGGHKNAAGGTLHLSKDQAFEVIVNSLRDHFEFRSKSE